MKKKLAVIMVALFSLGLFAGCSGSEPKETKEVKVVIPDGLPSMALAKMIKEKPEVMKGYDLNYTIEKTSENIVTSVLKGEADIAVVPSNVAATQYNINADVPTGNYEGVTGSKDQWEYRNKMEFTFGDMEKGGELTLGMHIKNKSFGIINVHECKIVDEDFRTIINLTVNYFRKQDLPYYRVMKREGYLRHLVIRKAKNTGELMVNLVTTTQIDFNLDEYVEILKNAKYEGKLVSIIHTENNSFSDAVVPEKVNVLYGIDHIQEELLGLKFNISPFSFFQTNTKGAESLYSIVREYMGDADNKVVFDLYCGTGTIGQIVAPNAKKVVGIELIEEAVEAAKENAKLNGLDNCEFIAGDVAVTIKNVKDKPDIIILDPPRSGVHPKALEYVIKFNAKEIIYVSCNPKTLVTDLKVLIDAGYEVIKTRVKDMFPNTPHGEVIIKLVRKL